MTVRVYRSTDFGAPQLSGEVGKLIAVLDACLVNGYGTNTITSLTQTGGLATATTNVPHQFTGNPAVLISGAGAPEYNGNVIATPTGESTFTFPVDSGAPGSAGGTPNVRRPGSGWTKPYPDGTYVAAYKQPTGSNGFHMRVDDNTSTTEARIVGYEAMTGVSAGTQAFPTTGQLAGGIYVVKSNSSNSITRPWVLVCNGPMMYLFVNWESSGTWQQTNGTMFGDAVSYKAGGSDPYATVIVGNTSSSYSANCIQLLSGTVNAPTSGHWVARPHTGIGGATAIGKLTDYPKSMGASSAGTSGITYPSPIDGGLYVAPFWIAEPAPTSAVRGEFPGLWCPLHYRPLAHGDIWKPATGPLAGKTFEAFNLYSNSQFFVETSDTW